MALALRLAGYELLRADGDDPVLILDDVFAELDSGRRERLAGLVGGAEQVLVTSGEVRTVAASRENHTCDLTLWWLSPLHVKLPRNALREGPAYKGIMT